MSKNISLLAKLARWPSQMRGHHLRNAISVLKEIVFLNNIWDKKGKLYSKHIFYALNNIKRETWYATLHE
jgi:hypothetical protein